VHEPEAHRFVLLRDGAELGFTEYRRRENEFRFIHTVIDPEIQERGLGTLLVTGALDWIRANTTDRVSASCPFVTAFLLRHPEYSDLTER
jgi:predicted GNAT family acetyltransferase